MTTNRKNAIKILIKVILFLGIYVGVQKAIVFALLDDTRAISRYMIHEIYTSEQNLDVLFCGASHCQLGINPYEMDQYLDQYSFNAASSAQGLETTYAMIREATAVHQVKRVVIDLDPEVVMRAQPNLESIYIVTDYMKHSPGKAYYLLNATDFDYYFNSFMPLHKGRGYIKDPAAILELIRKKLTPGYLRYTESPYGGRGYIASEDVNVDPNWDQENIILGSEIPQKQQKSISQIISFCEKKGIEVLFINTPVTQLQLQHTEMYEEYDAALRSFLAQYGAAYYDFNRADREKMDLVSVENYNDTSHLNIEGSAKFTHILAGLLTGETDPGELWTEEYIPVQ